MESRTVITWAIAAAAVIAGIALFMLQSGNQNRPRPTPTPSPVEEVLPPTEQLETSPLVFPSPVPAEVTTMAPTGASSGVLLAAAAATILGLGGLLFGRRLLSLQNR